jgi:ADP-ribosylglycohydrolase
MWVRIGKRSLKSNGGAAVLLTFDKIKAVIFGHAVADAVGVPAEFKSRAELKKSPITDMTGYGTYNLPKGTWSDDTSMSLATLESLKTGEISLRGIMENFSRWYNKGDFTPDGAVFDIGGICLEAISRYDRGVMPTECGSAQEYSNGNGSLMRIHPLTLYLYGLDMTLSQKIDLIHRASALTHAHIRSKIACGIYSFVLWALLDEASVSSVLRGLAAAKEFYKGESELSAYGRIFEGIASVSEKEIKSSGYVVDTLEAAIYCILTTKDYKNCILKAVNLGEDTDTVAAVAGGLAGALYGLNAIPKPWLRELRRADYIEDLCREAYEAWKN